MCQLASMWISMTVLNQHLHIQIHAHMQGISKMQTLTVLNAHKKAPKAKNNAALQATKRVPSSWHQRVLISMWIPFIPSPRAFTDSTHRVPMAWGQESRLHQNQTAGCLHAVLWFYQRLIMVIVNGPGVSNNMQLGDSSRGVFMDCRSVIYANKKWLLDEAKKLGQMCQWQRLNDFQPKSPKCYKMFVNDCVDSIGGW